MRLFMILSKVLLGIFCITGCTLQAHAQNHIRYHRKSLQVQRYMLDGEYGKALELLAKLDRKYGLMPTETYARAEAYAAIGDTGAARLSYLKAMEQHAPISWLFDSPPPFGPVTDSLWFARVIDDCMALWRSRPRYANGPNPGMPTSVTWCNDRYQFVVDSLTAIYGGYGAELVPHPEALRAYNKTREIQGLVLDSIIAGLLPLPSIPVVGVNQEFATFTIHCTDSCTYANRKVYYRWLQKGLIYPRVYAICVDGDMPYRYGYFNNLAPDELAPGYEKRRAAIGMGDDLLDGMRFHWGR